MHVVLTGGHQVGVGHVDGVRQLVLVQEHLQIMVGDSIYMKI